MNQQSHQFWNSRNGCINVVKTCWCWCYMLSHWGFMWTNLPPKQLCLFRCILVKLFYVNYRRSNKILPPILDKQKQTPLKSKKDSSAFLLTLSALSHIYCNWDLPWFSSGGTNAEHKYFWPHWNCFSVVLVVLLQQRQQRQRTEHSSGWGLTFACSAKCDS